MWDREYEFDVPTSLSLSKLLGIFRSYSGFQTMCKVKGVDEGEKLLGTVKRMYAICGFYLKISMN